MLYLALLFVIVENVCNGTRVVSTARRKNFLKKPPQPDSILGPPKHEASSQRLNEKPPHICGDFLARSNKTCMYPRPPNPPKLKLNAPQKVTCHSPTNATIRISEGKIQNPSTDITDISLCACTHVRAFRVRTMSWVLSRVRVWNRALAP